MNLPSIKLPWQTDLAAVSPSPRLYISYSKMEVLTNVVAAYTFIQILIGSALCYPSSVLLTSNIDAAQHNGRETIIPSVESSDDESRIYNVLDLSLVKKSVIEPTPELLSRLKAWRHYQYILLARGMLSDAAVRRLDMLDRAIIQLENALNAADTN